MNYHNQRRKSLRIGKNIVATVSTFNNNNKVAYIQDISANGAKIVCKDNISDIAKIKFQYNNVVYDVNCKIVRKDRNTDTYGVEFFFSNGDSMNFTDNTLVNNKNKLFNDILSEYFIS